MNKGHVLKLLSSYLDNQLSDKQRQGVAEHLKACGICREEFMRLKQLSDKFKAWHTDELGFDFDSRVIKEIVRRGLEGGRVKMKKKTLAVLIPTGALVSILAMVFCLGVVRNLKENIHGGLYEGADGIGDQSIPRAKVKPAEEGNLSLPHKTKFMIGASGGELRDQVITKADTLNGMGMPAQYVDYAAPRLESSLLLKDEYAKNAEAEGAFDYKGNEGKSYDDESEGSVIVIQPSLPATAEGEKIIRVGYIGVEVEDGTGAYKKAQEICKELGGYISSSNFYKDDKGRESGTITMRVPKDNFLAILDRLSVLGKVEQTTTNSQDVTQEYANIKAQLEAAMVVYEKTLEALKGRKVTIPEAMRLESELTPILKRVQELKNKLEKLDNAVSFTTVTLQFHEAEISEKVLEETRQTIKDSMLKARIDSIRFFAGNFTVVVTVGALIFFVLIAVLLIERAIRKHLKK